MGVKGFPELVRILKEGHEVRFNKTNISNICDIKNSDKNK